MSTWSLQTPAAWTLLLVLGMAAHSLVVLRTRRSAGRKISLVALNVLLGLLLWLFLQPPSSRVGGDTITLITSGATPQEVKRAQRARKAVAIIDGSPVEFDSRQVSQHLDLASVRLSHPDARALDVVGAGLGEDQWDMDRSFEIRFDAPVPTPGIRHAHWKPRIKVDEPLLVAGRTAGVSTTQVQLIDPAGDLADSAPVNGDGTFTLTDSFRSPGRFVYRLELVDDGDVIESQPVPVHVAEPEPINLMMMLSSPSFESRSLKNWAAQGGARLIIRTKISASRYLDEFISRAAAPPETLNQLDRSLLDTFDAVIMDQRAWHQLDSPQRNSVYSAIEESGLGLAVLVRDAQQPLDNEGRFPALVPYSERERSLALGLGPGLPTSTANAVALAAARFEFDLADDYVVLTDDSNVPVAAAKPVGKGRTAVTLVTDSHTWVTTGQTKTHARYWQTLIESVAPTSAQPSVELSPLPQINQRVQICMFGQTLAKEAVIDKNLSIALRPHAYRPKEHCGYWWPDRPGWHTLSLSGLTRQTFVFSPQDYAPMRHANASAATLLAAQSAITGLDATKPRLSAMPRWWFALLSLIVASVLWLEQKLQGR